MSQSSLIKWFEQFLFGQDESYIDPPSNTLYKLLARLEADGISVRDVVTQGGITNFRYQILGDFDVFLDYLEKEHEDDTFPIFRTRVMTTFFNQYMASVARRLHTSPLPPEEDKTTLANILSNSPGPYHYTSATFWGELVRQWLSHRRPIPKDLMPLPHASTRDEKRTACLYEVTCQERGDRIDPLSMYMVPASEYVNAVHWQSDTLLENFIKQRPRHPLATSVQKLFLRALYQFLNGIYPTCLDIKDPNINGFLENVTVIHSTIPEVTVLTSPPLVVDVFQRLLALANLDNLWKQSCSASKAVESPVTDAFHLTEQLLLAERQNKILMKHIPCEYTNCKP